MPSACRTIPSCAPSWTVLEPFNYTMMLDANGEIRVLHIISLRREAAGSALAAHLSPETRSNDRSLGDEPETLTGLDELRMEDRLLI